MHANVVSVHVLPWQFQKLMFVLPAERLLLEFFSLVRWQRRLSNFSDQVGCRCFRQAINQDTKKGNFDEDIEAKPEAEKNAGSVLEPQLLLLLIVANTRKVWLELRRMVSDVDERSKRMTYQFAHQRAGREIGL